MNFTLIISSLFKILNLSKVKINRNKLRFIPLLMLGICLLLSCSYKDKLTATNLSLAPIYSSDMVFRYGDTLKINGKCSPFGVVGVKLQNGLKYITADESGNWEVKFPPIDYKGTFRISIIGAEKEIVLDNLVSGELWVVLGDTWIPESPKSYSDELTTPTFVSNSKVRIFNPSVLVSANGGTGAKWDVLDNRNLSQRRYFASLLGNTLSEKEDGPVGIINLAHTGTKVNNFSAYYRELATATINADSAWQDYFRTYAEAKFLADSSFKGIERDVLERYFDDWEWSDFSMPLITSKRWYLQNKIAWIRKKIYIPEKNINSDFTLNLGAVRGQYDFYFNGTHLMKFVGESENLLVNVPDTLLKVWTNLLTVRMVAADTLSGIYNAEPTIYNVDSSYFRTLSADWKIRTYYEPTLPKVIKSNLLWPKVFENYLQVYKGISVDGIVIAGGVNMYAQTDVEAQQDMLRTISTAFNSDKKFLYLVSEPGTVDAMVNADYFNATRNDQLKAAARESWTTINTLDVSIHQKLETLHIEMVSKLIE